MNVSFTTTATIRPEILELTYASFKKNLRGVNMRDCCLYLNIDPAPKDSVDRIAEVVSVAKSFFGQVVTRTPKQPNFCSSVKWLWGSSSSEYIFHLEDDWDMIFPVDLNNVIRMFQEKASLQQVRLRKPGKEDTLHLYGLSPCIIRKSFYSVAARKLSDAANPERQLRHAEKIGLPAKSSKTVRVWPNYIVVADIGQTWRKSRNIDKGPDENKFVAWSEK